MNFLEYFIPSHIKKMQAYIPGLQLNTQIIKLNTNENPFPLPDFILEKIYKIVEENRFHLYPDPESKILKKKLSLIYHKKIEQILFGNGSDEILSIVFRTFLEPGDKILVLHPSYSLYPVLANMLNVKTILVPLNEDYTVNKNLVIEYCNQYNPKLVIITNPNAPTGISLSKKEILELYHFLNKPLLIDEAYVFFGGDSVVEEAGSEEFPMLMVCSTFSKAFSMAGLRLGWLIANPVWIQEINKIRDSYNINIFTQRVGEIIIDHWEYFQEKIKEIIKIREWFIDMLNSLNFHTLPSCANFVYTSPPDKNGNNLYNYLLSNGILVRYFKENPAFVRISIGKKHDMEILYEKLKKYK